MLSGFSKRRGVSEADKLQPGSTSVLSVDGGHSAVDRSVVGSDSVSTAWGPVAGIFWAIGIFVGVQFVVALLAFAALRAYGVDEGRIDTILTSSVAAQFLYIFLIESVTVAGILLYVRHKKGTLAQLGLTRISLRHIWLALAGFAVYFIAYVVIASLASSLVPSLDTEQEQDIGFDNAITTLQLLLTFCSLAVLPPLAEEIVFRGFMFGGLRRAWKFMPAAIVTSLLFAAGHLFGGYSDEPLLWIAALDTFVLSMVLCHLREKSGSLWPSIFVHAIKNSLAFSLLFLLN